MCILREELEYQPVGAMQILCVAGERHPAKRPLPLAEERPDVFRHEAGNRERVRHAGVARFGPDVVAVVEGDRTPFLQVEHRLHVGRNARARAPHIVVGRGAPQLGRLGGTEAGGDVAVQRVVRRRLIRHDVRREAAAHQRRQHLGAVAHDPDRERGSALSRIRSPRERLVQRCRRAVDIARLQPPLHARRIRLHRQTDPFIHRGGEGLGTTHPAEPAREHDPPAQRSLELGSCNCAKRLVRALENSLRPDVDPRPGGHLPVHDQAPPLEVVEHLPRRVPADEIRVRDEHARRVSVRREHTDRLP